MGVTREDESKARAAFWRWPNSGASTQMMVISLTIMTTIHRPSASGVGVAGGSAAAAADIIRGDQIVGGGSAVEVVGIVGGGRIVGGGL